MEIHKLKNTIVRKITSIYSDAHVTITNKSNDHIHSHSDIAKKKPITHLEIEISSASINNMKIKDRYNAIHRCLAEEFEKIHSISLKFTNS